MLYSIKKERTWETKRQRHKYKNLWDDTHPLLCYPHPDLNQPPTAYLILPSFIITIQWSQNSWYKGDNLIYVGSIRNDKLTLGIWCRPLSQHLLFPGRHQPHLLIISAQAINQKKAKNPEMRFNSQQIVSYCLGLRTQNPGLREVDLEPSPKRGSDKINMLK